MNFSKSCWTVTIAKNVWSSSLFTKSIALKSINGNCIQMTTHWEFNKRGSHNINSISLCAEILNIEFVGESNLNGVQSWHLSLAQLPSAPEGWCQCHCPQLHPQLLLHLLICMQTMKTISTFNVLFAFVFKMKQNASRVVDRYIAKQRWLHEF